MAGPDALNFQPIKLPKPLFDVPPTPAGAAPAGPAASPWSAAAPAAAPAAPSAASPWSAAAPAVASAPASGSPVVQAPARASIPSTPIPAGSGFETAPQALGPPQGTPALQKWGMAAPRDVANQPQLPTTPTSVAPGSPAALAPGAPGSPWARGAPVPAGSIPDLAAGAARGSKGASAPGGAFPAGGSKMTLQEMSALMQGYQPRQSPTETAQSQILGLHSEMFQAQLHELNAAHAADLEGAKTADARKIATDKYMKAKAQHIHEYVQQLQQLGVAPLQIEELRRMTQQAGGT